MKTPDLVGKRFGRLVVTERELQRRSKHDVFWKCRCDCGAEKYVATGHLTSGTVKSCGCMKREQAIQRAKEAAKDNVKHGEAGTNLYYVWNCMRQRCENPKTRAFRWYGAKGVRVCDEWLDYERFAEWARANGYYEQHDVARAEKLSIDRIDSDGDYCPENCRWVTVHENSIRATRARRKKSGSATSTERSARTRMAVSVDGVQPGIAPGIGIVLCNT